ncbi:MAG: hypothetical protein RLZZ67_344 [Candidatus Parcubacteria bacterium]
MEAGNISTRTVTASTLATSIPTGSTSTTTGMTTATTTSGCRPPGSHSSIRGNFRQKRKFLLTIFRRLNPASEHSSYLIKVRLDDDVFLGVNRLDVLHEADADSQKIKFDARLLEGRQFL